MSAWDLELLGLGTAAVVVVEFAIVSVVAAIRALRRTAVPAHRSERARADKSGIAG